MSLCRDLSFRSSQGSELACCASQNLGLGTRQDRWGALGFHVGGSGFKVCGLELEVKELGA